MQTTVTDLVEVLATAQIHDGTRVIVLTAQEPYPGHFIIKTTAYDSAHPDDDHFKSQHSGSDLDALLAAVREHGARTFERADDYDGCDCWATWDPYCGRSGCWGVYKPDAARGEAFQRTAFPSAPAL
ncbi:MAG TPA: hypothetical protein VGL02_03130 [Streptomyces sp.]